MTAPSRRISRFVFVSLLLALIGSASAMAAGSSSVISRGFDYSGRISITAGAIVSGKNGHPGTIELATTKNVGRLMGVVANQPLAAISTQNKQTQVVLSGATVVLVSDVNGPVRAGDKITASPIAGVGMLATDNGQVIGTVDQTLDTKKASTRRIADASGISHDVHIGAVPAEVSVAYYQQPGSNFLPPFLQHLANSVAGRPVSVLRILVSGFILLCGFAYVGIVIFTSVRTSVISLGRNPLAAHDIRQNLLQMTLLAMIVLAATLLATYLMISL